MADPASTVVLDPEGAHPAALHRLADFRGLRVLEFGCGDGRLTLSIAHDATHVFAFDQDAEAVGRARQSLPHELSDRVAYEVACGNEIRIEPHSFDLTVFSWSLWCVEPEDVVDVLRNMVEAVKPGGLVLDLQVIRPNPVVEVQGRHLCEIDGEALLLKADAAAAAIDALVRAGFIVEEAVDDHDAFEHYASGIELIDDYAESQRNLPDDALPVLRSLAEACVVREHCRLRRLRVLWPHPACAARVSQRRSLLRTRLS